jgi:chromosome segregation ATPase
VKQEDLGPKLVEKSDQKSVTNQMQQLQQATIPNQRKFEDFSTEFRIEEPMESKYKPETDWHGKYLMGAMSAKIEQLQEQSKRESEKMQELARGMHQRERESREQIEVLQRKLEHESDKVNQLLQELSKQNQRNELIHVKKDTTIQQLQERIEQLGNKFDQYATQQSEVGNAVVHTSKELMLETQRSQDTVKAVKKHEMQLVTISQALESNSESFARKMQLAAQELVQKVEAESKARRKLEESIRTDAMEFRRVIERHISDRVESLHSYTAAKQEQDRQEFESIAMGLQSKLQRLEATSADSQEQLVLMMNQRLEILETSLIESEKANQNAEMRIQEAIKTSMEVFEALIVKKDVENEKRFKEVSKNMMQMQKAIAGSLDLSEKSIQTKLKNHEEVLRAEIKARMETDKAVTVLGQDLKQVNDNAHAQIEKLNLLIDGLQTDHDKVLDLVKGVTQQITKSQDKWISNFESEVARLNDSIKREGQQLSKVVHNAKQELDAMRLELAQDVDGKLLEWEGKSSEAQQRIGELQSSIIEMDEKYRSIHQDLDQKLIARSVQFDSTLQALKLELSARPTHEAIQMKLSHFEQDMEFLRSEVNDEVNQIRGNLNSSDRDQVLKDHVESQLASLKEELEQKWSESTAPMKASIKEIILNADEDKELLDSLQKQIDTLIQNGETIDEAVNQHSMDLHQLKVFQKETMNTARQFEAEFKAIAKQIEQAKDEMTKNAKSVNSLQKQIESVEETANEKAESIMKAVDEEVQNIHSKIDRNSEALVNLRKENEREFQDQKQQWKESLQNVQTNQKQLHLELQKKMGNMLAELNETNDSTMKRISKLSTTLESQSRSLQRELASVEDGMKEFEINQATVKDAITSIANQLETFQDASCSMSQRTDSELGELRDTIRTLISKNSENEKFVRQQFNEYSKMNMNEVEGFVTQFKTLNEQMLKTKQQMETRIREVQSKCEHLSKELRTIYTQQSKLAVDWTKNVRVEEAERIESVPAYVEPLNSKIDSLVEQMRHLEDSFAQAQYQSSSPSRRTDYEKSYETTPASFYKPSYTSRQEKQPASVSASSESISLPSFSKANSTKDYQASRSQTAKSHKSISIQEPAENQRGEILSGNPSTMMSQQPSLHNLNQHPSQRQSAGQEAPISKQSSIFGQFRSESYKSVKSSKTPVSPGMNSSKLSQREIFTPKAQSSMRSSSMQELDPELTRPQDETTTNETTDPIPLQHTPSNLEF